MTAHRQYPIVHYFFIPRLRYSMTRLYFICADYIALRSAIELAEARDLAFNAFDNIVKQSLHSFRGVALAPAPQSREEEDSAERSTWTIRIQEAMSQLDEAERPLDGDRNTCIQAYIQSRRRWNPELRAAAAYFNESWEDVSYSTGRPATK